MGYDCVRFLNKVDEEFLCSICMLVIENPVQTHCEHLFCEGCIKDWLCVSKRCPVDSRPLTINDLSEPSRVLRSLLNKLDIKCDFQSAGCQTVTKLENLGHHVSKCVYNLNGEVVCDKGCNLPMTRRKYQKNDNCVSHLAKEVAEEVAKLGHELTEQKCHFERQDEEISKLRHELTEQKCHFERRVNRQDEEIKKLYKESSRQKELIENPKSHQKQEIVELCADNLLSELQKWQQTQNIKIGPMNLLEKENPSCLSFVQSVHALEPTKSCFKIHCTTSKHNEYCYVGLTRGVFFREWLDGRKLFSQLFYDFDKANNFLHYFSCKNGDVIKCSIEFPKDFTNDGNNSAPVRVSVNQTVIFQKTYVIPTDGFFPTIIWLPISDVKSFSFSSSLFIPEMKWDGFDRKVAY